MELEINPCINGTIVSVLKGRLDTVSSPEFAISMMPLTGNTNRKRAFSSDRYRGAVLPTIPILTSYSR